MVGVATWRSFTIFDDREPYILSLHFDNHMLFYPCNYIFENVHFTQTKPNKQTIFILISNTSLKNQMITLIPSIYGYNVKQKKVLRDLWRLCFA